jgi:hypothetical protein
VLLNIYPILLKITQVMKILLGEMLVCPVSECIMECEEFSHQEIRSDATNEKCVSNVLVVAAYQPFEG